MRRFVEAEIVPHLEELEHGDLPPYDILRKLFATFGMDAMARDRFEQQIEREKRGRRGRASEAPPSGERGGGGDGRRMTMIPIIELCRYCPGHGHRDGRERWASPRRRSCRKGTIAQKERWALDLLTLDKIGAWAITEPGSGSDAFGSMKSTARRDGDEYLLNGSKTFITNGPYADTIVFICKLDEGNPPAERKIL